MLRQRGISLSGLLVASVVIIFAALLLFRVLPAYIEYFTVKKTLNRIASDPEMQKATPAQIRSAFGKSSQIDDITAVTPQDLEISKDNNRLVLNASYAKRVPIVANVSACFDFLASSE